MTGFGSQKPQDGTAARDAGGPGYDHECERIEAALVASERGRHFLAAYAHRHRGADTETLLRAIARLETVVTQETHRETQAELRGDAQGETRDDLAALTAMAATVAAARAEIGESADATEPFEAVVQAAETTTSEILAAAESMQEAAWRLRETGVDERLCDLLDRHASAIGTACAAQDRTTRASLGIARTLSSLETRIAAAIAAGAIAAGAAAHHRPGSHVPAPAPIPAEDEIDFVAAGPSAEAPVSEPPQAAVPDAPAEDALATAFADLDRLSIEEKIALFS